MKFLDKFSNIANRVAQGATELAGSVSDKYKKEGFQGIVKTTEDGVNKAVDSTKNYFQEIGESAKEAMTESEKNVGKGTISGKVASGLVGAISVTQEVAGDVTKLSKRIFNSISENVGSTEETTDNAKKTDVKIEISLEKVLTDVIGAKNVLTSEGAKSRTWIDPKNTKIQILDDSWYSTSDNVGGQGAVSLLAFHLSKVIERDYNNKQNQELLNKQATQILQSHLAKKSDVSSEKKPVATKKTTKTVAKKTPVAKNEKNAVKEYENAGVVKKTVKRTSKKTDPVSKPEAAAVKLHEKTSKPATKAPAKRVAAKKTSTTVAAKKAVRKP